MRGIIVSFVLASSVYAGGCGTVMTSFISSDITTAANGGGAGLNAAMYYNGTFKPHIQRLEIMYGMLQTIKINVGTEAGTSTMSVSWSSLVVTLAQKIGSSATSNEDVSYLLAPLGAKAAIVKQYVTRCAGRDETENIILMIDKMAEADVLPLFLGRANIYMKNGNPHAIKKQSEDDMPIGTVPYSRMPPI